MKRVFVLIFWCIVTASPAFAEAPKGAGLFPIVQGGKSGDMDRRGKVVIKPQFDQAIDFLQGGLAGVRVGEVWGAIDTAGNMVVEPRYDQPPTFGAEGLSFMTIDGQQACIDKTGATPAGLQFENPCV